MYCFLVLSVSFLTHFFQIFFFCALLSDNFRPQADSKHSKNVLFQNLIYFQEYFFQNKNNIILSNYNFNKIFFFHV